jgi:hypothetical protein
VPKLRPRAPSPSSAPAQEDPVQYAEILNADDRTAQAQPLQSGGNEGEIDYVHLEWNR